MRIIAIANQKGGVGKTTTAINLSASLAHLGRKTLLIDMDPQGNSGRGLGIDIALSKLTVYEALAKSESLTNCIASSGVPNLDVVPANLRLASLEASLYQEAIEHPFHLLAAKTQALPNDYDYVIIDCPPSLGLLSLNALAASDSVIIPVQCEYFAMEAVAAILSTISKVKSSYNPRLKIEGFLLTMYDPRTQLGTEISSQVRHLFKENTFLTSIPRNQSIAESQARQVPAYIFRPSSQGATSYLALAREVIDHEER